MLRHIVEPGFIGRCCSHLIVRPGGAREVWHAVLLQVRDVGVGADRRLYRLALAPPALAAKLPSRRHYAHHGADIYGTRARYASPIYRCRSGRHYTYAGGWGCDYYVYAPDDLLRRR